MAPLTSAWFLKEIAAKKNKKKSSQYSCSAFTMQFVQRRDYLINLLLNG